VVKLVDTLSWGG